jgi:hypothetical protein
MKSEKITNISNRLSCLTPDVENIWYDLRLERRRLLDAGAAEDSPQIRTIDTAFDFVNLACTALVSAHGQLLHPAARGEK